MAYDTMSNFSLVYPLPTFIASGILMEDLHLRGSKNFNSHNQTMAVEPHHFLPDILA